MRMCTRARTVVAPISLFNWSREQSGSDASNTGAERTGRLMQDVGWQEGVIQSVANFMFQNRRQVRRNTQSPRECFENVLSNHACLWFDYSSNSEGFVPVFEPDENALCQCRERMHSSISECCCPLKSRIV